MKKEQKWQIFTSNKEHFVANSAYSQFFHSPTTVLSSLNFTILSNFVRKSKNFQPILSSKWKKIAMFLNWEDKNTSLDYFHMQPEHIWDTFW